MSIDASLIEIDNSLSGLPCRDVSSSKEDSVVSNINEEGEADASISESKVGDKSSINGGPNLDLPDDNKEETNPVSSKELLNQQYEHLTSSVQDSLTDENTNDDEGLIDCEISDEELMNNSDTHFNPEVSTQSVNESVNQPSEIQLNYLTFSTHT